jgi:hypothetical protein
MFIADRLRVVKAGRKLEKPVGPDMFQGDFPVVPGETFFSGGRRPGHPIKKRVSPLRV